jgi:hypothetical protein
VAEAGDVPVAVVSSRPSLHLAINTWVPGYLASPADDIDTVIELTGDEGVVVLDLTASDPAYLLGELRDRGARSRVVVLAPAGLEVAPELADVVAPLDASIAELGAAIGDARSRPARPPKRPRRRRRYEPPTVPDYPGSSPATATPTSSAPAARRRRAQAAPGATPASRGGAALPDAATGRASDAAEDRERRDRRSWWPRRRAADTSARGPVGDDGKADGLEYDGGLVPGLAGPNASAPLFPPAYEPPPVRSKEIQERVAPTPPPPDASPDAPLTSIERGTAPVAWQILQRLEHAVRGGSAMVGVRSEDGTYAVVAATGIAPLEAAAGITGGHAMLDALAHLGGIVVIADATESPISLYGMPFEGCPTLLAASTALPGGLDSIVLLTRSRAFSEHDGDTVRAVLDELSRQDDPSMQGWSLASHTAPPSRPSILDAAAIAASWELLHRLYPELTAAAAVVALRTSHGGYGVVAGVRNELSDGTRPVRPSESLLRRLHASGGHLVVRPRDEERGELGDLPLTYYAHVAVLALGSPESPVGLVFVGRDRAFEAAEIATLQRLIGA